ncbi:D-alanine--D-alanine ligase [Nocardioidaceae bacterium]|nr:D-alanine--D-alanine ligase [Nocardioidaceae bacterium]
MDETPHRPRVVVVFGGRSAEHGISCVSAGNVLKALDRSAYDVVAVGIARDGTWVLLDADGEGLQLGDDGSLPEVTTEGRPRVALQQGTGHLVADGAGVPGEALGPIDVVFPVMHGAYGQDGTLQGMLELAGVRYVGAGVLASAIGTDKHQTKTVLRAHGIPVLPWELVRADDYDRDPAGVRERVSALGFPVFVKPSRAGSSYGITRVTHEDGLDAAIAAAREHDPRIVVEAAAADAREFEIGVLQGRRGAPPECSVLAEVRVDEGFDFYDFEAKYLAEEQTSLDVPADVPDELALAARELGARVFTALGVEGLSRVDFFCLGEGELVVNEIETMPGFTSTSMFPRVWDASGVDYATLCDRLVQLALERSDGLR